MLKKKLVTIVAAVFCVALVTAQESGVFKTTTGLIEDGAIDSLKFGTEDGSGVIFGQYDNANKKITLGWGNSLSDTLWLSVFDSWYYKASDAKVTDSATNNSTADDGINVDYTATTKDTVDQNKTAIKNDLGVGVGINNKLGFQLVWGADYTLYKNPVSIPVGDGTTIATYVITGPVAKDDGNTAGVITKSEANDPGDGTNTTKEWAKVVNHTMDNNFTVNFKGIGIEDVGDIAFFVKLNKVYFNWNNITRAGEYTETSTTNGKKTSETTITAKATENTLNPGLNFDLGLNLVSNDVATVKFVYEDDFNMTFKPRTNEAEKAEKTFGTTTEVTKKSTYKVEYGKYLAWSNKFEPKLVSEFNVLDGLQLKAQLALPVTIGQTIDEAAKTESSTQTETFTRSSGYSYLTAAKVTTTKAATHLRAGTASTYDEDQNSNEFTTTFAPKLSAGFVYQVAPGKFNVNFGAEVQPIYSWTTKTKTNSGINEVKTTETKNEYGNSNTSKTVTAGKGNNVTETRVTEATTVCSTSVNLGATWFFTDNISFDVYFLNGFGSGTSVSNTITGTTVNTTVNAAGSIFGTSQAGASVTVKF